ncbi:glycosyltransferase family 4 protein [Hamadaea tsunoensis]|uniref:glycosyltransferase family 4 protein n=1 Tax=Hamadaea tsunoensis TaxID=53368 RepID=UPI0003F74A73|nr:glycosyltransferase family 4 protein [Hamadaea tsunoensis]
MKILILNWKDLAHPAAGGAEIYTHEVARRWVRDGHAVTLVCAAVAGRPESEVVDGVLVRRMGSRLGVYGAARRWYADHGRGRFDVVIDEVNTKPFGAATWAAGTPVVGLIHQVCREIWHAQVNPLLAPVGRYLLEPRWLSRFRGTPVVTVSPSSAASLAEHGLSDITVVPPGLDLRPRPDVTRAAAPTLISVGRLSPTKRPEHILAALRLVRRSIPDTELWFVGDGPLRDRLTRHAPAGVRFFGRVGDETRDELLARAHVHVITSVREGWAMVVDEAAAMGTPTIGYDRPGLRDSIPSAAGVLTAPNPAALAEEITARLPGHVEQPAPAGWRGGTADWDLVAERLLAAIASRTGLALTLTGARR